MRSLLVTFVAVLAMILLMSPVQADQVSADAQNVIEEVQPIGDHGWGGDDPDYNWWTSLWVLIMDILYFYHLDVI